jgi:hypothetical protein
VAAGVLSFRKKQFVERAVKAPGRIVEIIKETDDEGNNSYHPRVEFKTPEGRSFTFTSSVGGNSDEFQPGDPLEILYEAAHPDGAEINEFWQLWLIPVILAGFGGILLFFAGILVFFLSRGTATAARRSRGRVA